MGEKIDVLTALKNTTVKIREWTDEKLENKVNKDGNKKLTDENYTTAEKTKLGEMPTGLQVLENKLYLTNDDGIIESTATTLPSGSGGGGSSSASITLVNLLDSNEITVATGSSANLVFEYASSETDAAGTAYIYVGDVLKRTYSIIPGENTLDIGELVGEGVNNVKLTVSDIYSNSKSLSFVINSISLKLTSTFDDSQIFDGDVTIRYIATGAISKDLHMILDGVDTIIDTTSETGKQRTYTIGKDSLYHGAHDITLYLSASVNDIEIVSNKLHYSIVAIDSNVITPIIASTCTVDTLTQGEQLQIDYLVFDPSNMETEVSLLVYSNGELYSETKRVVDATKQTWSTRDLPIGTVDLKIVYGVAERLHQVMVLENDINITIKETDLEFNLSAAGKSNTDTDRDVWESNGIKATFENINYESTGWISDENGDSALRLSGKSKVIINTYPFVNDARLTGKTIELEFKIKDVNNIENVAVSCFDGNIGFQVKADTAMIKSEQSSISCNYTDEERVYVSFVIEPRTEYRLIYIYLNGVISGVKQYPENDNWQSNNPQYIEIGSPYCSIDLYSIRSYSTALTHDEILNNYIASITDISERLAVYENNNIYDIYGNLSFDKLKNKLPIFVATGASLPTYKGDKKKMAVSFTHPRKPSLNYEDSSTLDVQGTSSQFFPKKNFKSKTSQYHMIDTDKIETNVVCLKTDFMNSSGNHNTPGANYVHTLYGDAKVPPQKADSRVRTTIWGFPCLVFWKSDSAATPEFVGRYNYNYDKSSVAAYGFTDEYPDAFSVEFCNNTSDACLFHGEISDNWEDDFEYRHPDGYENIEDSGFKEMHSWVVSTYQDAATNIELLEPYIDVDGITHTNDTAEYRLAKFKTEFEEHFDMTFALVYYIYAMTGIYMDSLAKNLFLTTFDRQHWYAYWYDMDSCWTINNEGVKYCSPFVEDIDTIDGAKIFNGQDSSLWVNFRMAFADKIQKFYAQLRSDKLLSYDKIIEYFINNHTKQLSESIFNQDAIYKYISMLMSDGDASYLFLAQGTEEEYLKYVAKNRFSYLDSKWYAGDYPDDLVSLRIYTPSAENLAVEPNANITVTPYSNYYAGVRYKANGTLQQIRAEANNPVTFKAPDEIFNDTETAIYGASNISSLGDLSPLYCGTINLSNATKLVEIIVGNGTEGYSNSNLKEIIVGTNTLLKKIDVQNCPNLVDPLALSNCPNIEEIYAQGTSITAVELPSSGYLKVCKLPGTLTNLTITNQQYIEEFTLDGYDVLTTLHVEQAVNIPVEDIMLNAPNLNRIRLLDISWEAESEEALASTITKFKSCLGLDANGNNIDKAVVTGYVKVPSISDELYNDIYENFPNLVVDDGSGKPYIINFLDRSGDSLFVTRLAEGEDAFDPIETGDIERPADIETEDAKYIFAGWSTIPTNVHSHYRITPVYITQYAVKYYNDTTLLWTEYVDTGSAAPDIVVNGTISAPIKAGTDDLRYSFSGWDNLPTNVQRTTNVYAQYNNVYPVRYYSDSSTLHYTQWVIEGQDAFDPIANSDVEAPTKESTVEDMFYVFSAWDNIPTNIIEITEVHATYDTYWAVRFYNDGIEVDMQKIKDGSSAVDPITRIDNPIATPTRESTAQYDYTFSKWDGNYTNITEPTQVYATYNSITRKYKVTFYNLENGNKILLWTQENVPYGTDATDPTTNGNIETPIKLGVEDSTKYDFTGWNPSYKNIQGNTECYAIFRYNAYLFGKLEDSDNPDWNLINSYWTQIDNDCTTLQSDGMTYDEFKTKYPIGGRMLIPFTLSDGIEYVADVEIIAYNHDDIADSSGSKAILTFLCKDLPDCKHKMYENRVNTGGWKDSDMRAFTNGELLEAFPEELQNIIQPVYKVADGGANSRSLVTTTDYCWIPSYDEVGFGNSRQDNVWGQGVCYSDTFEYGNANYTRIKYTSDHYTVGKWWLRTSCYGDSVLFLRIRSDNGGVQSDGLWGSYNVAFGFCIGCID